MEVVITESPRAAAATAASVVRGALRADPSLVLGVATGSSPLLMYQDLAVSVERNEISFSQARAFLLDEYVGLEADHPERYGVFIERSFTRHVDFGRSAVFGPDGSSDDLADACRQYESMIASAGGIGLQILGIGVDGHIGFNEPMSSLSSRTRLKTLTMATRVANARFFSDNVDAVPRHVVTQGIGTILDAGHLLLIATGGNKAEAIARAVEGPLTSMVPASALQLHPRVTIVVDESAAEHLSYADYYRETFNSKPTWQTL